jgi:hypothetical protein
LLFLAALNLNAQNPAPNSPPGEDAAASQLHFKLEDPVPLPIGTTGAAVRDTFNCTSDAVFLQGTPVSGDSAGAFWDIALYGVQSPSEIIRFDARRASGYRELSPIGNYFASESELVGLALGIPRDAELLANEKRRRGDPAVRTILLTFDRKGFLTASKTMDENLMPKQVGVFESGDLLFVDWDKVRKKTYLLVTGSDGDPIREINLQDHEPGNAAVGGFSLWGVKLLAYGKNLLVIPEDPHAEILEVCETGVVRSYTLKVPKDYGRWQPVSVSRRSWTFRLVSSQKPPVPAEPKKDPRPERGLEAMSRENAMVVEFDPEDGSIVRQIKLPESGAQPVCGQNGEFVFLGIQASDGKLTFGKGAVMQ